jgi:hypothetical protein
MLFAGVGVPGVAAGAVHLPLVGTGQRRVAQKSVVIAL